MFPIMFFAVLTDDGSKKLAVVLSEGGAPVGTGLLPRAMPTMAVMWVSGPKTKSGMSMFLPSSRITLYVVS